MDHLAAISAAFYESLHAHFDLVFNDVTDRDAGYYQHVEGNPHTWWGPADFIRQDRYIAGFTRRTHTRGRALAAPVGDTQLNDTWDHFRDNRLQWWLGADSAAAPARHARRRGDRPAVRRGRDRQHDRAERRRVLLPAGPALRGPPARASASGVA